MRKLLSKHNKNYLINKNTKNLTIIKNKEGLYMYTKEEKDKFIEVAESLKKYRRAEIKDKNDNTILDSLYVDLLPKILF